MRQTVGIPFARDNHGGRFGRAAIDRTPQPFVKPLVCHGFGSRVRAVPTHPMTTRDAVTVRTAHYGLLGHGKHRPGCRYDFERQAQQLLVECRGRVQRRDEQYRLLLPDADEPQRPAPVDGGRPRASTGPRLVVQPADRPVWDEALASTRRIARLLRHFEHDPAAVQRFRAQYRAR